MAENIRIIRGNSQDGFAKDGVMVGSRLANRLNLSVGEEFIFKYPTKYRGIHEEKYKLGAIYESDTKLNNIIFFLRY